MRYLQMENVTIHTMRHSYASNLARLGRPIGEIALCLGDSQRVTEAHYLHHQPHHQDFSYLYGEDLIQAREQELARRWQEIRINRLLNPKAHRLPEFYKRESFSQALEKFGGAISNNESNLLDNALCHRGE